MGGPARWLPPSGRRRRASAPQPSRTARAPAAPRPTCHKAPATGAADELGRALRCTARQGTATAGRRAGQAQPVRRLSGGRQAQRRRGGRRADPGRASGARSAGGAKASAIEARTGRDPTGARCTARERDPAIGRETLNCFCSALLCGTRGEHLPNRRIRRGGWSSRKAGSSDQTCARSR